jgi:hypothetical protein
MAQTLGGLVQNPGAPSWSGCQNFMRIARFARTLDKRPLGQGVGSHAAPLVINRFKIDSSCGSQCSLSGKGKPNEMKSKSAWGFFDRENEAIARNQAFFGMGSRQRSFNSAA